METVPIPTAVAVRDDAPAFVVEPAMEVVAVPVEVVLVPLLSVAFALAVVKDQGEVFWAG
ncbi:MAG: hypothetical protein NVS2B16_13250 [Chloroflexota bacterium]